MKILGSIKGFHETVLCVLVLFSGCGKKIGSEKKEARPAPTISPVISDNEKFLQRQQVICEDGTCPESIIKVVAFEKKESRICTGFLVNEDVVVTSSSCLPDILRKSDQDCSSDVHFFLAKTRRHLSQRIGCQKVILTSDILGKSPVLWRDDIAFLKMISKAEGRTHYKFSRDGVTHNSILSLWGIDQVDSDVGLIRKQNCRAIHKSFVNPLAENDFSPGQVFGNCFFKNGTSGAPLLNSQGQVLSIASSAISRDLISYIESTGLLKSPLSPMIHATNLSCAPTILDREVADERECFKKWDEMALIEAREKSIANEDVFDLKREEISSQLENSNMFLNFQVEKLISGDYGTFTITPRCFKNLSDWVFKVPTSRGNYGFSLQMPQIKMKRFINNFSEVGVEVVSDLSQDIYVEFSVKRLRKSRVSDVIFWGDLSSSNFPEISEKCI